MVTGSSSSRRSMCPLCSKPSRLCLCTRITAPLLTNSVAVTILQHSLERKHPLNSTRIAALGLKNLNVVSVSEVNFEARFQVSDGGGTEDAVFGNSSSSHIGSVNPEEEKTKYVGNRGEPDPSTKIEQIPRRVEGPLIHFTIHKYGAMSSFVHHRMPIAPCREHNFDLRLSAPALLDALAKGFVVKKWQSKQLNGSIGSQEFEDFEITVPPGSVLLFPSEKSVGIEDVDFEVKNLIVLDGTWPKARRMYNENPWLKFLPHLKLDLDARSLYGEVRHQPRAGCLSTIESIVFALKAVGEETDGLDNLLEVFESMVGDQSRCKDERLAKISQANRHKLWEIGDSFGIMNPNFPYSHPRGHEIIKHWPVRGKSGTATRLACPLACVDISAQA